MEQFIALAKKLCEDVSEAHWESVEKRINTQSKGGDLVELSVLLLSGSVGSGVVGEGQDDILDDSFWLFLGKLPAEAEKSKKSGSHKRAGGKGSQCQPGKKQKTQKRAAGASLDKNKKKSTDQAAEESVTKKEEMLPGQADEAWINDNLQGVGCLMAEAGTTVVLCGKEEMFQAPFKNLFPAGTRELTKIQHQTQLHQAPVPDRSFTAQEVRKARELAAFLDGPLQVSADWNKKINDCFDGSKDELEIMSKMGTHEVSRKDLRTLRPRQWLNDAIINYFVVLWREQLAKDDSSKTYIFSSFFFTKIQEDHWGGKPSCEGYCHKNVSRWSKFFPGVLSCSCSF